MSSSYLGVWQGLSGEHRGAPLSGVFFAAVVDSDGGQRKIEVSDDWCLDDESDVDICALSECLPTQEELLALEAAGHLIEITQPQLAQGAGIDEDARIKQALEIAYNSAAAGGAERKAWVIDQMVRALTGERYAGWVASFEVGDDDIPIYKWPTGA